METSNKLVEQINDALPVHGDSPESLARLLKVSVGTIRRWVREGKLKANWQNGRLFLPLDGNREFVLAKFRTRRDVEPKAWMPKELEDYGEWHEILDELVWLFKICIAQLEMRENSPLIN